jgi:hypothetical protein
MQEEDPSHVDDSFDIDALDVDEDDVKNFITTASGNSLVER